MGKLGFYLLRIHDDHTDVHFIRTKGEMENPSKERLVTCTSASLPNSPLGITLHHPITPIAELPHTYPFAIRQKARNDQHFLACLELGAKHIRFPWRDLCDPFQHKRLQMLHSEGVNLTATYLEPDLSALLEQIQKHSDLIHTWEIQIPGTAMPSEEATQTLKQCSELTELSLCPIISNERVPGKQHLRTRTGYRVDELNDLNTHLQNADLHLNRVLCRIPPNESPWTFIQSLSEYTCSNIGDIDLSLELDTQNDRINAHRISEAVFATATRPSSRLFVGPLVDFDRTMDVYHGLLDTRCNPRPTFHTFRSLNTLLFSPIHSHTYTNPSTQSESEFQSHHITNQNRKLTLLLPSKSATQYSHSETVSQHATFRTYDLATGETEIHTNGESLPQTDTFPTLIISQTL